jgi:hypothetical protein
MTNFTEVGFNTKRYYSYGSTRRGRRASTTWLVITFAAGFCLGVLAVEFGFIRII